MRNLEPTLVSVVIPCYNQAGFLGEAIESIGAQSHANFEIIVVDDGSTDCTSDMAARYGDVQLISQTNQGLAAARNAGIRASRGDYLVFLDADDRLLPDALEAGLKALSASPECAFVSGHYRLIEANGEPIMAHHSPCAGTHHYAALLRRNYIGMHATVMYRRSALDRFAGFDAALRACEDYDLYLRIAQSLPVLCHHRLVAEYRQHGNNLSRDAVLMLKTSLTALRRQWKPSRRDKELRDAYKTGIRHLRSYYGGKLIKQIRAHRQAGEWGGVGRGLSALLRYHPQGFAKQAAGMVIRRALRAPKSIAAKLLNRCNQQATSRAWGQDDPKGR